MVRYGKVRYCNKTYQERLDKYDHKIDTFFGMRIVQHKNLSGKTHTYVDIHVYENNENIIRKFL